jgi:hypothetical protein
MFVMNYNESLSTVCILNTGSLFWTITSGMYWMYTQWTGFIYTPGSGSALKWKRGNAPRLLLNFGTDEDLFWCYSVSGGALQIGDRVIVASSMAGTKTGTLRYLGPADFAKGEWAGIELDAPLGENRTF